MTINEEITLSNLWWNGGLRGFLFRDQATETLEELVSAVGGDRDPNVFSDLEDRVEQNYTDVEDFEEDCYSESVEYLLENLGYDIADDDEEDIEGCKGVGAARAGSVDEAAVREILLYFENDLDLYHRHEEPIRYMLLKKLRKGVQLDLDYFAKSSMIDAVVRDTLKQYFKQFGSFYVSTATRNAMKHEIAQSIFVGAQDDYECELNND